VILYTIRPEEPADREASLEVERRAFESEAEVDIIRAVRDLEGSFALVADDEEIVGHVQSSRVSVGTGHVSSLGPIGVIPERQGQGIGRALVEAAIEAAGELGEPAIVLLGNPDLYGRFGFETASQWGLRNPFAGNTEHGFTILEEDFMLVPLSDAVADLAGEVRWHPAFGEPG
jgi:putative acetyltransferase